MSGKPEQVQYRLQKAAETLAEVDVLLEKGYWNTAVNRMYYACYYAISALLIQNDVETASHAGVRQKFGQLFILTGLIDRGLGRHFSGLFEKRQKGDYDDFFDLDENTAKRLLAPSQELIRTVSILIEARTV